MTWYEITHPTAGPPFYKLSYVLATSAAQAKGEIAIGVEPEQWGLISVREVSAREYLEALKAHLEQYPESNEIDLSKISQ